MSAGSSLPTQQAAQATPAAYPVQQGIVNAGSSVPSQPASTATQQGANNAGSSVAAQQSAQSVPAAQQSVNSASSNVASQTGQGTASPYTAQQGVMNAGANGQSQQAAAKSGGTATQGVSGSPAKASLPQQGNTHTAMVQGPAVSLFDLSQKFVLVGQGTVTSARASAIHPKSMFVACFVCTSDLCVHYRSGGEDTQQCSHTISLLP